MADSDNLKIQEQLNKLLTDRKQMLSAQSREIQNQLNFTLQLKEALAAMDATKLSDSLEGVQKALEEVGNKSQGLNGVTSEALNGISEGAEKATRSTTKLEKQTKLLAAKFPALKSVSSAALHGLSQGFENLVSLTQGTVGFVDGLVSSIFQLGKSILAIPLKIFQGLLESAVSFSGDTSLAQAFENIRKEFGSFKEDISKNVITAAKSMQGELANTGLSVWRVFGTLAERLDYFREVAEGAGAQMHQFGVEIASNAEAVGAFGKGLGIASKEMKEVMDRATVFGTSLQEQFRLTANYSLQMGKAFGMSQKVLAKDIAMMMKDVKNFGSLTQKEMSIATVYTRKLGIEVKNLVGLIDKFDTFEDAANAAAQMSQAFGTSVDAFKLMNEQDPSKRLDMLRKSMLAAGKTTENMSRQELKLLSQTSGLDEATAKLAFSAKNQGLSYDDVKKKAEVAEKAQLSQAQALSKLADSIERLVKSGGQMTASFLDMFLKGFSMGVKNSQPFLELMINLRQALWATLEAGRKVGQMFVDMFPGFKGFLNNMSEMFSPKKFSVLLNGVTSSFQKFFEDLSSGKTSVKQLIENLRKSFFDYFDVNSAAGRTFLDNAKKSLRALASIVGEGGRYVVETLTKAIQGLTDFIKDPKGFLDKLKAGAASGTSFGLSILEPLITSLGDPKIWQSLWGSIKGLFVTVWGKAEVWFKGPEFAAIVSKLWPIIAGVMFGPALVSALTSAFLASIAKIFTGAGNGVINTFVKGTERVAAAAADASKKTSGPIPDAKDVPSTGYVSSVSSLIKSLAQLKISEVIKAGINSVIFAAFISTGMVALITGIGVASNVLGAMNVQTDKFVAAVGGMAAIAISSVPLMMSLKLISKLTLGESLKGMLVLSSTVLVMGGVMAGLVAMMGMFDPKKVTAVTLGLTAMALVFGAAALIIPVATGIGALVTGPQALILLSTAAGLGVIVTVVEAMALTMIGIMKQIDQVSFGVGFEEKVRAFSEVMKAVGSFAGNVAQIIEASRPSILELLGGHGDTLKNMQEMQAFVKEFVGTSGGNSGIQGIIVSIQDASKTLSASPEILKASEAFASVLSSVGTLASSLMPPPDTKSTMDSIINALKEDSSDTQLKDLTNYIKRMVEVLVGDGNSGFISSIKKAMIDISSVQFTKESMSGLDAFTKITNAIVGIVKTITPSPEFVKTIKSTASTSDFWGASKTGFETFDTNAISAMGDFFARIMNSMMPLIKILTGDVLKNVTALASSIDEKQIKKINIVTGIISTVSSFMGTLSEIAARANTSESKVDGNVTTMVTKTFPSITDVFSQLQKSIPTLVSAFTNTEMPKDIGVFTRKLDVIKKVFDLTGQLTGIFKGILGQENLSSEGIVKSISNVTAAISSVFFGGKSVGTVVSPMTELMNNVQRIVGVKEFDNTASAQKAASTLKSTADSVSIISTAMLSLSTSAGSISKIDLGATLANTDFNKKFGIAQIAPFIDGMKNFAKELTGLSKNVGENSVGVAIKTTQDIIKSVNDLNDILASGDVNKMSVSTNLKKFVDSAGLGSKSSYTINNKGVQMTVNLEVKMMASDVEEVVVLRKESIIREAMLGVPNLNDTLSNKLRNPRYQ